MQSSSRFSQRIKNESKRAEMIEQEHALFMELTGMNLPHAERINFLDEITKFLKDLLGINELTDLRKAVIKKAIDG